jgi:exopolyphosphatase/guanosine-5'-triphosphate,3'-diphosphate pyrophosphatase
MPARIEEVEALMVLHEREPEHVLQVRKMAMMLFDSLCDVHGYGSDERFILEAAALLHDIGHVHAPDGRGHHKWSARMIREHPWKLVDPQARELIACVARYHRKSAPSPEHEEFAALEPAGQRLVAGLAALLRIADCLDRSHLQVIRTIHVRTEAGKILIQSDATGDTTAERAMFHKKAELFESVFDTKIALTGNAA